MDEINEYWMHITENGIHIGVAVCIVLITVFLFILKRFIDSRAHTVLIVGLNDAGKTQLFSKLISKDFTQPTYSSLKENIFENFSCKDGEKITLIDVPGSERIRKNFLSKYFLEKRKYVKGIIFVIDSITFSKKVRDVAEFLYDVLYDSNKRVRTLVVCNKQDSDLAKSCEAIQSAVEREIGLINGTREAALETTDGTTGKRILTSTGRNFQWNDTPKAQIRFVECCTTPEEECCLDRHFDLKEVKMWLENL